MNLPTDTETERERPAGLAPASARPVAAIAGPVVERSLLIDVVRGIAISLVVLGHTNQGIVHRAWWGQSRVGPVLDALVYSFHMPAFFFISGIFLCASVQKRGEKRFTIDKLRTMIYPYLLWSCIFALSTIPLARFMMQKTPSWHEFWVNLATGKASWFLPTIFFAVIVAMLLRRVPMPILFLGVCLLALFWPGIHLTFVDRGIDHLPFLVAGMWIGRDVERIDDGPVWLAGVSAVALCGVLIAAAMSSYVQSKYLFLPLGLIGTLMLLLVARVLGRSSVARFFSWAGVASFGIFLLSEFPQGGGRELLLRMHHITNPYPQLLFPTLLAILIPAWIYHNRARLRMAWMFDWPW